TGLLRGEMGFEGLIVTDGIEMKAIHNTWGAIEATLMSVVAGANLVCICHDMPYQIGASERLTKALETGELTEEILNERVERILKYKKDLTVDLDGTYEDVKAIVENDETKKASSNIVENAVTRSEEHTSELQSRENLVCSL